MKQNDTKKEKQISSFADDYCRIKKMKEKERKVSRLEYDFKFIFKLQLPFWIFKKMKKEK